jgi:hypothetical protein
MNQIQIILLLSGGGILGTIARYGVQSIMPTGLPLGDLQPQNEKISGNTTAHLMAIAPPEWLCANLIRSLGIDLFSQYREIALDTNKSYYEDPLFVNHQAVYFSRHSAGDTMPSDRWGRVVL